MIRPERVALVFHFKWNNKSVTSLALGVVDILMNSSILPAVSWVSTDGDVFVADYFNHRIKILDQSLRFKQHVTHQSKKHPLDVKLTRDEMYVLCNSFPCVLVLSHAGEMTANKCALEVINCLLFY